MANKKNDLSENQFILSEKEPKNSETIMETSHLFSNLSMISRK